MRDYLKSCPNFSCVIEDGIFHLRLHSNDGPFVWERDVSRHLGDILQEIDADPEVRVILLSGTGDDFCASVDLASFAGVTWDSITWRNKRYISALLNLEKPIVAAVQGRCTVHAEVALLSDIVIASEDAMFGDQAHLPRNVVPGDGSHVLWPVLLGPNRGRYLLLAEQYLTAKEALAAGIVGEVVEKPQLMPRAWALARQLAAKPPIVLRNTRTALVRPMRKAFDDALAFGLALEGSAYGSNSHPGAKAIPGSKADAGKDQE